jgi:hypothetical protein
MVEDRVTAAKGDANCLDTWTRATDARVGAAMGSP